MHMCGDPLRAYDACVGCACALAVWLASRDLASAGGPAIADALSSDIRSSVRSPSGAFSGEPRSMLRE
eukprot:312804-Chlamydomonas_euryale.AAC.2